MQFNVMGLLCPGSCRAAFFKHSTLVFAMRVSFVYMVLMVFSISMLLAEDVKSQSIDTLRVTVEMNNETLPQLFDKIKAQTGLLFGYRQGEIDQVQPFTFSRQTGSVRSILDLVLANTSLQYKQVNNSVVVFEVETPISQNAILQPVTGIIKDKAGTPMPGVSIYVKGTNTGTVTDKDGQFSIDAKPEDVLVFTFIGYKKIEEQVGARSVIELTLEEDTNVLDEVVISGGYYKTTDELRTGNIVKVNAKEIGNQPVTSPLMALQGQVAGLDITPNSGTPGNAPVIRIRGNNSLRNERNTTSSINGNYPLYVIDGVQISSVPLRSWTIQGDLSYGGYDPLSTINPSDIESIEILKDGDATSIYGSRGANGVIIVTTKRNRKANDHTNLDFKFFSGVSRVANRIDLLNTPEYVAMRKEGARNDGISINDTRYYPDIVYWDTTRYTDWQDVLFGGTAKSTDILGGFSGGNKNTSFRFSAGYHKSTLVTPGDFDYQRGTGNLSVNHTSRNEKFNASLTVSYGIDKTDMPGGGSLVGSALTLAPNAPKVYDENGKLNWEIRELTPGYPQPTFDNPLAFLESPRENAKSTLITSGSLSYEIFPGISISANLGLTNIDNEERRMSTIRGAKPVVYVGSKIYGSSDFIDDKRTSWSIEPQASLNKTWDAHHLDFMVGSSFQRSTGTAKIIQGSEYISDALLGSLKGAGKIDVVQDDFSEYKFASFLSRAAYNYAAKYLLSLTLRRDGSSRFGPGKRFGTFWSVAPAWIFSKETLIKENLPFLSFGKVRASYGITGSDQIGDYKYYNLYNVQTEQYQGTRGFVPTELFNPDFAWEETSKLEGAIELGFFEGLISTEVSWYRNRSSNQIVSYPLPATTGFTSVQQNSVATVQNSGLEILVRSTILNSQKWTWNLSFNISFNYNKLIEFDGLEDSPYSTIYKVGEPTTLQSLFEFTGINPETGLYTVRDRNKDGIINDLDRKLSGPIEKVPYGGFINAFRYQNLEVSFNFYFARKDTKRFYNANPPGGPSNQPVDVLDRWQKPGDITNIQRFGINDPSTGYYYATQSDYNIVDGSFIRLKSLSLGYSLPDKWLARIRLQQAKIFVEGQNLFTISQYSSGLDPETGATSLPPLQTITLGLQLTL